VAAEDEALETSRVIEFENAFEARNIDSNPDGGHFIMIYIELLRSIGYIYRLYPKASKNIPKNIRFSIY
jgi:hypothetical protein